MPGKFQMTGGRAGAITFSDGDRSGSMDWEMLTGDIHLAIRAEDCRWTAPVPLQMDRADAIRIVREFASESGLRVAIEFADAPPRIYPDDAETA